MLDVSETIVTRVFDYLCDSGLITPILIVLFFVLMICAVRYIWHISLSDFFDKKDKPAEDDFDYGYWRDIYDKK